MLKELIAVGMASILISQPPQNTNDGTYYQDVNITETYEYETNEVNSVDDLVVGNIYKVSINNEDFNNLVLNTRFIEFTALYKMNVKQTINNQSVNYDFDAYHGEQVLFGFYKASSNTIVNYLDYNNPALAIRDLVVMPNDLIQSMEFYIIFSALKYNNFLPHISASDYLGEKTITVEPVETEGLYNLAYNFLYSRIYTNTQLQGMETTLFGETINMNMWLSHTTAIVIICLLLIVLIKFVIWLFKIVSGGMLWR